MSLYLAEHDMLSSLTSLQQWQDAFLAKLSTNPYPAWVFRGDEEIFGPEALSLTAEVIGQADYVEGQDGRETLICPGVIGVSKELMVLAETVNTKKELFKSYCKRLHLLSDDREHVRNTLSHHGFARLNLNHAYRQLPLTDAKPIKVSFTWASTRSITRINREEAIKRLESMGDDPSLRRQIDAAKALPTYETLVIVQTLKSHLKANLTWIRNSEYQRRLITCPLPLLIPFDGGSSFPKCVRALKTQERRPRRDVKIEPFAFLPAIRGYRYLPEYR